MTHVTFSSATPASNFDNFLAAAHATATTIQTLISLQNDQVSEYVGMHVPAERRMLIKEALPWSNMFGLRKQWQRGQTVRRSGLSRGLLSIQNHSRALRLRVLIQCSGWILQTMSDLPTSCQATEIEAQQNP